MSTINPTDGNQFIHLSPEALGNDPRIQNQQPSSSGSIFQNADQQQRYDQIIGKRSYDNLKNASREDVALMREAAQMGDKRAENWLKEYDKKANIQSNEGNNRIQDGTTGADSTAVEVRGADGKNYVQIGNGEHNAEVLLPNDDKNKQ